MNYEPNPINNTVINSVYLMPAKKHVKIVSLILMYLFLNLACPAVTAGANKSRNPKRLRRSESFLGIHFDFHARSTDENIGENVTRQMVEAIIDQVKPDYIQCDCKGHEGLSSYPTKVGNPAPGIISDTLRVWRDVTAERGVALYMHYSGVWDNEAVKHHPEWARIDEKGQPDKKLTSVYGQYVDKLLIPQLKELCDEYGVDGVWIDGECWAVRRDYGENVIKAFQKQTGIQNIPRKPNDPHWFEFSEFCRDGFRNYLNHYVTEIHKHSPGFQIASNWAYSSMMPEPAKIDVDFISGDFSPRNSLNTARLEARCMVHQAKPWDLMAWNFTRHDGQYCTKTALQLKQEAAIVLSLGGGFQAYFPQRRNGSVKLWQMKLMSEVAGFCRARQSICHRARAVPQIGLIYSGKAFYRINAKLFAPWSGELIPLSGILRCLLNSQNVVDIVMEHHLTENMERFPLLIYPEWEYIDPDFKRQLLEYVKNGGSLLIIGPKAAALFENELGIKFVGQPLVKVNGLEHNGRLAGINSMFRKIEPLNGTRPFGKIYHTNNDIYGTYETAATIRQYGKGKIAAAYLDLGERYCNAATTVSRDFLNALVRELFPEPVVEVAGSHLVDVTVNRINGKLAVNLVNTAGPHANEKIRGFDQIPPAGPLKITIRCNMKAKPRKITLEPAGKKIPFKYLDGKVELTLPELLIHDIIVVE